MTFYVICNHTMTHMVKWNRTWNWTCNWNIIGWLKHDTVDSWIEYCNDYSLAYDTELYLELPSYARLTSRTSEPTLSLTTMQIRTRHSGHYSTKRHASPMMNSCASEFLDDGAGWTIKSSAILAYHMLSCAALRHWLLAHEESRFFCLKVTSAAYVADVVGIAYIIIIT